MQVIPRAVRHTLLDEMPAVAGGIHRHIVAAPADAALQNRFEGGKIIVVGGKAQVVDEQDELQRVFRQFVHQRRDLIQLGLFDLDQAQPIGCKLVGNSLDRTGLSGARVAVQKHVVGGLAVQQGLGVGDDFLPLALITRQLAEALRVGTLHRHKAAVLQGKDVIPCKHAVALFARLLPPGAVGGGVIGIGGRQPAGHEIRHRAEQFLRCRGAQRLQKRQFSVQRTLQHGAGVAPCRHLQAEIFVFQHQLQQNLCPVGAAHKHGSLKGRHSGGVPDIRLQGRRERAQQLGIQQPPKHHKPVQAGRPIFSKHKQKHPFPRKSAFSINCLAESFKMY